MRAPPPNPNIIDSIISLWFFVLLIQLQIFLLNYVVFFYYRSVRFSFVWFVLRFQNLCLYHIFNHLIDVNLIDRAQSVYIVCLMAFLYFCNSLNLPNCISNCSIQFHLNILCNSINTYLAFNSNAFLCSNWFHTYARNSFDSISFHRLIDSYIFASISSIYYTQYTEVFIFCYTYVRISSIVDQSDYSEISFIAYLVCTLYEPIFVIVLHTFHLIGLFITYRMQA